MHVDLDSTFLEVYAASRPQGDINGKGGGWEGLTQRTSHAVPTRSKHQSLSLLPSILTG